MKNLFEKGLLSDSKKVLCISKFVLPIEVGKAADALMHIFSKLPKLVCSSRRDTTRGLKTPIGGAGFPFAAWFLVKLVESSSILGLPYCTKANLSGSRLKLIPVSFAKVSGVSP